MKSTASISSTDYTNSLLIAIENTEYNLMDLEESIKQNKKAQ